MAIGIEANSAGIGIEADAAVIGILASIILVRYRYLFRYRTGSGICISFHAGHSGIQDSVAQKVQCSSESAA